MNKKPKVLLINPRISGDVRYGKYKDVGSYLPPYGLLSIAAVLEAGGHTVKVIDADSRKGLSIAEIKSILKAYQPDIVGMTIYSIGRDNSIATAKAIKSLVKGFLIAGGPHCTIASDDILTHDCFDMVAIGEGEYTLKDISLFFQNKITIDQIKGIAYKKGSNIIQTEPREDISDLDSLPFPAYHLLDDLGQYAPMQLLYHRKPGAVIISGRGCPFNCIFCNSLWGKKVRLNSSSYIIEYVKMLINKFGIKEIMFYEDTFCISKSRINELCDLIIHEKLDITWSCSANVRTLNKDLLLKMNSAGCWLISIGIESGNDDVLKFIKKPVTTAEAKKVCHWADEAGIKVRGFFMLGHPIDTEQTIQQTIDFAKSLPLYTINFCILQLLPGSEVRKIAHNYGEVNYDYRLGTGHPGETLSFVPKGLSNKYLLQMQRKGYQEFFIRPSQMWRLLKSIKTLADVQKYWSLFKTFIKLYLIK